MIAVLIAVAVAFGVCVLSTPLLIRVLHRRSIGQSIRDDGPVAHPHEAKAGTPTMGGIALVSAAFIGYLVAHVRTEAIKFADTALTMWFLIIGMALVGSIGAYVLAGRFTTSFAARALAAALARSPPFKATLRSRTTLRWAWSPTSSTCRS